MPFILILVIDMKNKYIIPITISLVISLLIGKTFFDNYKQNNVFAKELNNKVYMLKIIFNNKDNMKQKFKDYTYYIYKKENNKYSLYIGITSDIKNASVIKQHFSDKGYKVFIEEKNIKNKKFLSVLNEYDKIFKVIDKENIDNILKVIIENYKEMT